jgi:hypothetical protein
MSNYFYHMLKSVYVLYFTLSYKVGTVLACRSHYNLSKNMSNKIHYSLILLILYSLAANAQSKSGH